VTKYTIKKIELKEKGVSTLKPRKIWFDETIRRLNIEERGLLLGAFKGDDKLLVVTQHGTLKAVAPELSLHFNESVIHLQKWIPQKPITAVYFDTEKERYFLKRFLLESLEKEDNFIKEGGVLTYVGFDWRPLLTLRYEKQRGKDQPLDMEINVEEFISVKGSSALGNQLSRHYIKTISIVENKTNSDKNNKINIDTNSESNDLDSQIKINF